MSPALEARAQEELSSLGERQDVATLARQAIVSGIHTGDVSMEGLARRLSMGVATLRRRLAAEGTTHSELLGDVRKNLALSLLERREMNANEISYALRFASPSTFHRAFKRWTGTSPLLYRKSSG